MMNPDYQSLFESFRFNNGVAIDNKMVVAPMTHYGSDPDGSLSEQERAFLTGRAEGFGMFITAATLVAKGGKAFVGQPEAVGEKDLPSLRSRADLIKRQGAKAILQIHHGGILTNPDVNDGLDIVAPSADEKSGARALTGPEITDLIAAFGNATRLAIDAGFDGVEIHGANNYLIQQFWSGETNLRTDEWGGSLAKRMAFPLAVVDAVNQVKEQAGREEFIVGYRLSPEEPGERGLTMADTFALVDALAEKPLQYLHVSLWDFYKKARRGADTQRARMQLIHERLNGRMALIGVGNLFTAQHILAAYQTGWADLIAVGKTVLINPNIIALMKTGREAEITTTLDAQRADRYHFPDELWRQNMLKLDYLPPVKGATERSVESV